MTDPEHDDFLTRLHEPPRPEFAATLYERLHDERSTAMPHQFVTPVARHALRYVAALCLLCGVAAATSPGVRAGMLETVQRLRQIGGATFVESNRGWDGAHQPTAVAGAPRSVAQIQRVSVAEARTRVPYAFGLPTWTPEGAVLTDQVEVVDGASVILYWTFDGKHAFILRTYPPRGGTGLVGDGSTEAITVNGQPAALIRGMWDGGTGGWSRPQFVTLHWSVGGVTYELLANTDVGASEGDLRRIAESIH